MKSNHPTTISATALTLAASLFFAGNLAAATGTARDMTPTARFLLEAPAGQFLIQGTADSRLVVVDEAGGEVPGIEISGSEDDWTVRLEQPMLQDAESMLPIVISVPYAAEIEVRVAFASLELRELQGREVKVSTVRGTVRVADSRPDRLAIETVEASQHLASLGREETRLSTVSGSIEARGNGDELWLRTVSGPVSLRLSDFSRLQMESMSGDLQADLAPAARAEVRARSHDGEIRIAVPDDTPLDLRAESHFGTIASAFGEPTAGRQGTSSQLAHRIGDGTVRAELRSVEGRLMIGHREQAARALVFRERMHISDSRGGTARRPRLSQADVGGFVDIGFGEDPMLALAPGQFAVLDIPPGAEQIIASQERLPNPVALDLHQATDDLLHCFELTAIQDVSGSREFPVLRRGFEFSQVLCPHPEALGDYEEVRAGQGLDSD